MSRDLTDAMIPRRSAPGDSAPSLGAGGLVQGENKSHACAARASLRSKNVAPLFRGE